MPLRAFLPVLLLSLLLPLGACANRQDSPAPSAPATVGQNEAAQDFDFDDYDEQTEPSDPLGSWNRVWFSFNDKVMRYVLDPA